MDKIIVKTIPELENGAKSLASGMAADVFKAISQEELKSNFFNILQQTRSLFDLDNGITSAMYIKEVKVSFEISAKGEVRLIGSAGIEAAGAIEVTLSAR